MSDLVQENKKLRLQIELLVDHCKLESGECGVCAKIMCPYDEELHFHHDGCPACATAEDQAISIFEEKK